MERIYEIVITFVLSLILGAIGYVLGCNFTMTIFSVVAFTCFDILGYFFMVRSLSKATITFFGYGGHLMV